MVLNTKNTKFAIRLTCQHCCSSFREKSLSARPFAANAISFLLRNRATLTLYWKVAFIFFGAELRRRKTILSRYKLGFAHEHDKILLSTNLNDEANAQKMRTSAKRARDQLPTDRFNVKIILCTWSLKSSSRFHKFEYVFRERQLPSLDACDKRIYASASCFILLFDTNRTAQQRANCYLNLITLRLFAHNERKIINSLFFVHATTCDWEDFRCMFMCIALKMSCHLVTVD